MGKKLKLLITKLKKNNIFFFIVVLFLIVTGCSDKQKKVKDGSVTELQDSVPYSPLIKTGADSLSNNDRWANPPHIKLVGTWSRSDANYVLEIRSSADNGMLEAVYLNPNPINVEKAAWALRDQRLFVDIILRDVNYPGSSYTLQYSPLNDFLIGNYYQAVEGNNYDVLFLREK